MLDKLILATFALCISLAGCSSQVKDAAKYESTCHGNVQSSAKHHAEIVETSLREVQHNDTNYTRVIVNGRARLQNGFGAWTNYKYKCTMATPFSSDVSLTQGWH